MSNVYDITTGEQMPEKPARKRRKLTEEQVEALREQGRRNWARYVAKLEDEYRREQAPRRSRGRSR